MVKTPPCGRSRIYDLLFALLIALQFFVGLYSESSNIDPVLATLKRNDTTTPYSRSNENQTYIPVFQASQKGMPAPGFISSEKKSHLSGIRIEPAELGSDGFIGFTEKSVSIVAPNTEVKVAIFGFYLDEVILLGYTPNNNCSNTLYNVSQEDFTIQTDKRIVIVYEFPEGPNTIFKICMRQKKHEINGIETIDLPFSLVDDFRTSVSTDIPPRQYYFPFGIQVIIISCLLVLSGLFSGLNLGLMSLTPQELTLISNSGSDVERAYAQAILPVRKSGNFLLCALLIGNVCVNSAISILFDDLTSGYIALFASSAGIVVFGEIFPQALCVKKGLAVGARTIFITRFFMVLTFPFSYPISRVLDLVLGEEVVSYDRKRLMELIKMSTKNAGTAEELKIAIGAMEIADKTVSDVMTKIDDVFMLREDTILNTKVVAEIVRSGYTRIPVYSENRNKVVSLLFVKDLALLDPDDNFSVKTVCGYHDHALRMVIEDTPLRVMLEEFKKGDYHLAMVQKLVQTQNLETAYELVGIVTLEDIIEEILQAEIVDETDVITDNVNRTRRRRNQCHDLTIVDNANSSQCCISIQMQLVTVQFLVTKHPAFCSDKIVPSILEKVIRKHVHKVEVSHLAMDMDGPNMVFPRSARLYTKQEPSDKFILILEGRAMITIGQNEMTFEAGPWQCFGIELLDQLSHLVSQKPRTSSSASVAANHNPPCSGGCPLLANSNQQTSSLVKGSRTDSVPSTISVLLPNASALFTQQNLARSSQSHLPRISAGGQQGNPSAMISQLQQQAPATEFGAKKITFIPDYSVVIRDECTYLEISAQTYLLAYKSTLIIKNKGPKSCVPKGEPGGSHHNTESFRSLQNSFAIEEIEGGAASAASGECDDTVRAVYEDEPPSVLSTTAAPQQRVVKTILHPLALSNSPMRNDKNRWADQSDPEDDRTLVVNESSNHSRKTTPGKSPVAYHRKRQQQWKRTNSDSTLGLLIGDEMDDCVAGERPSNNNNIAPKHVGPVNDYRSHNGKGIIGNPTPVQLVCDQQPLITTMINDVDRIAGRFDDPDNDSIDLEAANPKNIHY